nr:hypothetical protein Iba_chr09eCG2990 [Ipomoea batatas]
MSTLPFSSPGKRLNFPSALLSIPHLTATGFPHPKSVAYTLFLGELAMPRKLAKNTLLFWATTGDFAQFWEEMESVAISELAFSLSFAMVSLLKWNTLSSNGGGAKELDNISPWRSNGRRMGRAMLPGNHGSRTGDKDN